MKLFKHFLKVSILLLLAISCTKDDTSEPTENIQKEYELIKTNFAELSKKEEFIKTSSLLSRHISVNSGFLKKSPLEDVNGFTIDSTQINKISAKGYTSYTFAILRDKSDENSFENLLVEIIEGKEEPRVSVIKYKYNKDTDGLAVVETYFVDYKTGARMGIGDCYVLTFVTEKQCPCAGHWPGQSCSCQSGPSSSTSHMFICSTTGSGGGGGGGYINYPSNPIPIRGPAPGTSVPNTVPVHGDNVNVGRRLFLASLSPEQRTWLAGKRPEAVYRSIFNFLISNNFSTPSSLFAKEAIDAMMRGGEVDFTYRIIKDPTFENNPCLNNVYTQLGNAPTFQNYLQNFDGDFSVANLKFSASGNLADFNNDPTTNAQTLTPLTSNLIEIQFNTNNLNRPSLEVARTMIHEMIHAEIYRKMLSCTNVPHVNFHNYSQQQWVTYINNLQSNFPGIYDYYVRWAVGNNNPGAQQHEQMAQHYINIIIQALKQFDNNSQSDDVYKSLAWEGLMGTGPFNESTGLPANPTVAWNHIPLAERLAIRAVRQNYLNNNTNSPCQ